MSFSNFYGHAFRVLLVAFGLAGCTPSASKAEMKDALHAMNCKSVSEGAAQQRLADLNRLPKYSRERDDRGVEVRFQLSLAAAAMQGGHMFITSQKTGKVVFAGQYVEKFLISAGQDLLARRGMDIFKFDFVSPSQRSVCSWEQEVGGPLWRVDMPVKIDFLSHRELDEDTNTLIAWKLR